VPDMAFELRLQAGGSTLSWVWRLVYGLDDLSLSGVVCGAEGGVHAGGDAGQSTASAETLRRRGERSHRGPDKKRSTACKNVTNASRRVMGKSGMRLKLTGMSRIASKSGSSHARIREVLQKAVGDGHTREGMFPSVVTP
jgi:hypothetical protein